MEMKRLRCARLGCGALFLVDQGAAFASVDDARAEKITLLRCALREATANRQFALAQSHAADILSMIPGDYMAKLLYALSQARLTANPLMYERLLSSGAECAPEEANEALSVALQNFDIHNETAIDQFIRAHFQGEEAERRLQSLSETSVKWKILQENYENIPRDAFICHSSSDAAVADRVYEWLKKEGYACWSSRRNLPPDTRDYESRIKSAIENCRVMVVVSSEQCMLRADPREEIKQAKALGKRLIEFKIDKTEHTEAFKYFFRGNQWVDGAGLTDAEYAALAARVTRELYGASAPEPASPAPAPAPRGETGGEEAQVTRAFIYMEDGEFEEAATYLEKALNQNPKNARAYLGKALCALRLRGEGALKTAPASIESHADYQRAKKFASPALRLQLEAFAREREAREKRRVSRPGICRKRARKRKTPPPPRGIRFRKRRAADTRRFPGFSKPRVRRMKRLRKTLMRINPPASAKRAGTPLSTMRAMKMRRTKNSSMRRLQSADAQVPTMKATTMNSMTTIERKTMILTRTMTNTTHRAMSWFL